MEKSPTLYALRWTLMDKAATDETRRGEMVSFHTSQDRALLYYRAQRTMPSQTFTTATSVNPQGEVGVIAIALREQDFGSNLSSFSALVRATQHWEQQGRVHTLRKFDEHGQLDALFTQPSFTLALRTADVMYLKTGEITSPPPAPLPPEKKPRRRRPPKPKAHG